MNSTCTSPELGLLHPTERVKVSAVMPCLNEEKTVGVCVSKAISAFASMGISGEVIVVDNGSTERSVEIAVAAGARVAREATRGYGAALRRGILEAKGDIIIMGDSDESYDWSSIEPFIRKIQGGQDLVIGNRFKGKKIAGAMPPLHRYVGNPVLSAIARVAFHTSVGDFHCGMRAFTAEAFKRMKTTTNGMEFATEMIANACHQRLRIAEIPTTLYRDKRDRAPHLRSFRDGWRHLRFILTYAPDYLFLFPGTSLLILGVLLQILLATGPANIYGLYLGIHFLALGGLLALVGLNVFNLGVFAKAILSRKYEGLESRTIRWLRSRYSLELGLVAGSILILGGLAVDMVLLARWLSDPGSPMESTIHIAFVASTAVALGVNLVFTAFLLNLLLERD